MGFQGQLSSVNLTDIFQTLSMNHQSGTLRVNSGEQVQHVYFEGGQVATCDAAPVDGTPFLLHALSRKSLLSVEQLAELSKRFTSTKQPLRDLVLASGYVTIADLDEVCAWCLEETICPIFEWRDGDFTFTDGGPSPEL